MSVLGLFAKRIAVGLFSAWVVLTTVFAAMTMTDDWVAQSIEGMLRFGNASEEEIEQALNAYMADRGYDRPLYEQYVDWMGNMLTLEWGDSLVSGEPVTALVVDGVVRTGMYVVPALVLGVCIGILVGLYAAVAPKSRVANLGRGTAYLLFALPSFWLGGFCVALVRGGVIDRPDLLFDHGLPILFITMTLLGGYVSYTRAHALEYTSTDFVALVKAKGASPLLVTRHIVRNAAIPLFSMLFTEVLALLVLAVFVIEMLFAIDGFGLLFLQAVMHRDFPIVLGGTIVVIVLGVVGSIVQDLSYSYLDPRVDTGRR
ncbi:ABC transporter permease [Natronobeatus ordinarius]|uniref:ABC transporter permease n=1 Tax=Natronobeatus ordinarius TaxID=2963433 RepID=UPI0020CCB10F|nr:ABC transporter permease [Natronobeatus ordinarius]